MELAAAIGKADVVNQFNNKWAEKNKEYTDTYTDLWKTFFHAVGIKERENYICQRNLFPKWKRKHAVEFRK
jgi:hypothetical protein